jgi:hypothetical protein
MDRKIGTSFGLAQDCDEDTYRPEQVYVWKESHDVRRPIRIEGWVGYRIPMQMRLTRDQTKSLIGLLVEALVND